MEKHVLHKSSASGKIDSLAQIAEQINSRWKRNADSIMENQHQQKRLKNSQDFSATQKDNGNYSNWVAIQRREGNSCHVDNETVQRLQSDLEKVRQKCGELESKNMQLRGRLLECDNFNDKISKLENEKEQLQQETERMKDLIEKHEKQSELDKDLRINFENEFKGRQKEIEDLQRQLDEMNDAEKEKSELENENMVLKNEISEMEGIFEEIQDQFENKLKEKNNEVVEMMVEWMDNHEVLASSQEENGKLKSENDCLKTKITKLTRELDEKQVEYGCQSDSLKKLEKDLKVKISEINVLNKSINLLNIKHDKKLKKAENEVNQLEKCIQQMTTTIQNSKDENEEITRKLFEMEANLKAKQAEIDLLYSDRDHILNFAEKLKKFTSFPDNENFPLVNQLDELKDHIKDKLRLMDWYVKTVSVLRGKGLQIDLPMPTPSLHFT